MFYFSSSSSSSSPLSSGFLPSSFSTSCFIWLHSSFSPAAPAPMIVPVPATSPAPATPPAACWPHLFRIARSATNPQVIDGEPLPVVYPRLWSYTGSTSSLGPLSIKALAQLSVPLEPPTNLILAPTNVTSPEIVIKPAVRLVTDSVFKGGCDGSEMRF